MKYILTVFSNSLLRLGFGYWEKLIIEIKAALMTWFPNTVSNITKNIANLIFLVIFFIWFCFPSTCRLVRFIFKASSFWRRRFCSTVVRCGVSFIVIPVGRMSGICTSRLWSQSVPRRGASLSFCSLNQQWIGKRFYIEYTTTTNFTVDISIQYNWASFASIIRVPILHSQITISYILIYRSLHFEIHKPSDHPFPANGVS